MARRAMTWAPQLGVYVLGLAAFTLYSRSQLTAQAEGFGTPFTYWDVVLDTAGSGYLLSYWILPVATWCVLGQMQTSARPENLVRYGTRTGWAVAQGLRALPWAVVLAISTVAVSLLAGIGFPFVWGWGPASLDEKLLVDFPSLTATLPVPALSLLLQVVTLTATLAALTIAVAAVAAGLGHPRMVTLWAVALMLWGFVSFRSDDGFLRMLSPSTYALPWLASVFLPFGPGGGVAVLLVGGALVYVAARWFELHRSRVAVGSPAVLAVGVGAVVLVGLIVARPGEELSPRWELLLLLQGVSLEGASLLDYLGVVLLALVPAVLVHRELVASLAGRRYAEMIRMASPARWYLRGLIAAAPFVAGYSLVLGAWAVVLVAVRVRSWPGVDVLALAGTWAAALAVQVIVVVVLLALGTLLARRVEGGAYAVAAVAVLAWPLGEVSRWSPTGQASLLRLTDVADGDPALVFPLALLVLLAWLAALVPLTAYLFNRTRGEIL